MRFFIIKIIFFLSFCGTSHGTEANSWRSQMRSMLENFLITYDELSKPSEKINTQKVKSSFKELTSIKKKSLNLKSTHLSKKDPLIANSFEKIDHRFQKASELFNSGDFKGAKRFLSSSVAMCVSCHRHGGSKFEIGSVVNSFNFDNPIFKARLLLALRDYKASKAQYEKVLDSTLQTNNNFLIDQVIGEYTSVLLSSSKSSKLKKRLAPLYYKKMNLVKSKTHKKVHQFIKEYNSKVDLNSTFSKLGFAETLMNSFENPEIMFTQEFEFLKSVMTYLYHSEMNNFSNKSLKAKTYFTLGRIYSNGALMDQFLLPEEYFESCIKESPYSAIAKNCYRELKRYITLGWTGSAGTKVPYSEKKRLAEMKKLAFK